MTIKESNNTFEGVSLTFMNKVHTENWSSSCVSPMLSQLHLPSKNFPSLRFGAPSSKSYHLPCTDQVLVLFDFICHLATCVHLLVLSTDHKFTQHLVHLWCLCRWEKLCNLGGLSLLPLEKCTEQPNIYTTLKNCIEKVSHHCSLEIHKAGQPTFLSINAQRRPTTLLWKIVESWPTILGHSV